MSKQALDAAIAAMTSAAQKNTDGQDAANTLLTTLNQLWKDATAAAAAAGATPEQLQQLTDLAAAQDKAAAKQAEAIVANTPAE